MKKLALVLLLGCVLLSTVGCGDYPRGILQTRVERGRRIDQATDLQYRGAIDDLDYVFMFDHVCQLSEYPLWFGW